MKIFSNDYQANLPTNKWPTKGGPARFSRLFSDMLTSRGHEWVGLVENYEGDEINTTLIDGKNNKKWWVIFLPKDYISKNFTRAERYKDPTVTGEILINKIKEIIIQEQPDIVFINGSSCFAWAYLAAAHNAKIPIVALHAGIWGIEIDLYSDFFTKNGIKILKKMERDFATLPTINVFLNETSKDYFIKNIYKIPKSKIEIIPLPCESSSINTKKKDKKKKSIVNVGIVARWDRIKNHKAFLDIANEAVSQNKKWKFFSVTSIPETNTNKEFKESYKKTIEVVAPMDQKSLRKFYRKMDIMILPSKFDVSPHVVLEAALEGVPTFISKNVGYAKMFTKNGLKDFIIDFSVTKKALKKIDSIINKRYPARFTKVLKETHNPKTIINKFEKLFKKIK